MRLTTLVTSFASLLTIAVAIPVAPEQHANPTPASAESMPPSSAAASYASSHFPTASPVGAYSCPPKQLKQCCQSLEETSKGIVKGLGEIVPILSGIQISSKISFQCKNMTPDEAPDNCKDDGYAPMCCSNDGSHGAIGACQPFGEVKEEYYRSFGYGQESQTDVIFDAVS